MTPYLVVVTTVPDRMTAERLAGELVDRRLAACVQIAGPLSSVYRWKGQRESASEFQVSAKTREHLYKEIEGAIRALHPYELPEILAFPVAAGDRAYLDWLERELTPPTP